VGDVLIDYDVDPTNANIKKADPVETQLLDIKAKVGPLASLATTIKTSIVAAINEIVGKIGNLSLLGTTDKTSAVNAINEVNTKVSKTEVLISNSGDAYSPSRPYAVGELCIYNNVLYRCTTACSAGSWATNQSCFTQVTLVNVVSDIDNSINDVNVISEINISNYKTPTNTFNIRADGYIQLIADGNVNNVVAAFIMPSNKKIANAIVAHEDVAVSNTFFVKKGMEFSFNLSETTYSRVMYYKLG
jgi:hypothetical protein